MAKIEALIEGYREFYKKYFKSGDKLYMELATEGQFPKTLVIACSDSRADPSIIMNAKPGDIFVVRNVANLVPPYEKDEHGFHHGVSSALEFAVKLLKVENIIVLGHSNCAGIGALLDSKKVEGSDFIETWVDIAKPAREKTLKEHKTHHQHHCERESIVLSLSNLLSFPWIKERVKKGDLKLHGWHFSIYKGSIRQYNPETNGFEKLS